MKKTLTEAILANQFVEVVCQGNWSDYFDPIKSLIPEMTCKQGRPDYVGATADCSYLGEDLRVALAAASEYPATLRLLSCFGGGSRISHDELLCKSGLSISVFKNSIRRLRNWNLVVESDDDGSLSSIMLDKISIQLWAFEVKLTNWKRALYQSLQSKAFAHKVCVVIPELFSIHFERNIELFERHGIGVIALDTDSGLLRQLSGSDWNPPTSKYHYLYAVSKFIRESESCSVICN